MKYHSAPDLWNNLNGYKLTTVEILYYLPDYPEVLQTFIWQNLDHSPDFPCLHSFLLFWEKNIEGRLFSVKVSQGENSRSREIRLMKDEFIFH